MNNFDRYAIQLKALITSLLEDTTHLKGHTNEENAVIVEKLDMAMSEAVDDFMESKMEQRLVIFVKAVINKLLNSLEMPMVPRLKLMRMIRRNLTSNELSSEHCIDKTLMRLLRSYRSDDDANQRFVGILMTLRLDLMIDNTKEFVTKFSTAIFAVLDELRRQQQLGNQIIAE